MNKWSKLLDVTSPECKKTGNCCRFSSPSTPGVLLLKKAAENDEFARDYLSIFIPYSSLEDVRKLNERVVEKNLEVLQKQKCGKVNADNIVFYYCRFLADNNSCMIYEDRPSLCRDFPDSPFLVLAPGCAYQEWSDECKKKYAQLKEDIQKKKEELKNLKYQRKATRLLNQLKRINNDEYKTAFILPSLNLVSPGTSWIKLY
ncbi:MAG: hypothetical protein A2287_10395 [Candidatus Melainabacteria bacterium RIFOXYA12_FULL_32_12]|nr:MAG: hypothetical protein A2255_05530 [Candidatus Melainabacteria bacterium RIFOXYA2_FULL_32_9]OGI29190.1 MAG: hypothetical protein A2287_10395 [Candidatus Melainabacteria bacterium RIFOXYA12_FULL_32_12]